MKKSNKLKHITICLLAPFIFLSCETKNVVVKDPEAEVTKIMGRELVIYTIDSCEYIGEIYGGSGDMITHKGNCKFCVERSKK